MTLKVGDIVIAKYKSTPQRIYKVDKTGPTVCTLQSMQDRELFVSIENNGVELASKTNVIPFIKQKIEDALSIVNKLEKFASRLESVQVDEGAKKDIIEILKYEETITDEDIKSIIKKCGTIDDIESTISNIGNVLM